MAQEGAWVAGFFRSFDKVYMSGNSASLATDHKKVPSSTTSEARSPLADASIPSQQRTWYLDSQRLRTPAASSNTNTTILSSGIEQIYQTFQKIDGDLDRAVNQWASNMNYGRAVLNEGILTGIWRTLRGQRLIADEIADGFERFASASSDVRNSYAALRTELQRGNPTITSLERFSSAFCDYIDQCSQLKQQVDRYSLRGMDGIKKALYAALDVLTTVAAVTGVGALLSGALRGGGTAVLQTFSRLGATLATKDAWKRIAIRTAVFSGLLSGLETTTALQAKNALKQFSEDPQKGIKEFEILLTQMDRQAGNNPKLRKALADARDGLNESQKQLLVNGKVDPKFISRMLIQITATTLLFEAVGASRGLARTRQPFRGLTANQIKEKFRPPVEIPEAAVVRGPEIAPNNYDRVFYTWKTNIKSSPAKVEMYFHVDPQGKHPSNWRINVKIGSKDYVAILPEGTKLPSLETIDLSKLELVEKKGKWLAAVDADLKHEATATQRDLLNRGHFPPLKGTRK